MGRHTGARNCRVLPLGLLLAVFLAACSGGSQQAEPSGSAADATSSDEVEDGGSGGDVDPKAVLLTMEDMPAGWTEGAPIGGDQFPTRAPDARLNVPMCGSEPLEGWDSIADGSANFAAGEKGPFVVHSVRVYEDEHATEAMNAFEEARDSCDEWTNERTDVTYRHETLSFPSYGDQTAAERISGQGEQLSLRGNIVVWRRGNVLSTLLLATESGSPDDKRFESMTETADKRLADIAP